MKNYSHRKLAVEPIWGFMKVILGFTQVSARSINKVKGKKFLLTVLNNCNQKKTKQLLHCLVIPQFILLFFLFFNVLF